MMKPDDPKRTENAPSLRSEPPGPALRVAYPKQRAGSDRPPSDADAPADWARTAAGREVLDQVLTPDALSFVADLGDHFAAARDALLEERRIRQAGLDAGERLDFLPETREVRESKWRIAPVPDALQDRRVEITGPVDRKMIINALNSTANVFMADFEDATAPTFENVMRGQLNLRDAIRRQIDFTDSKSGKNYALADNTATLMVRPRGLHLPEVHLERRGRATVASLVDFGLYFFHNAQTLIDSGAGPFFYLPKLEHHLEARWWNDVISHSEKLLGLKAGVTKATVLIETLPAAFQMEEILYELREHSAGLNCGRWDYIFSYIKKSRRDPSRILPDRSEVGMAQPFMRAYTQLLVQTCHRRGAHAMGGMAAQIPIKNDPEANERAMAKVRTDKQREADDGHDGTWVAHPGLVPIAREIFDAKLTGPNQLSVMREDVSVDAEDLLRAPTGKRTEAGLRQNVRVGIQYIEAWLRGHGCVPLENLMEDAATAEISRSQVWQWLRYGAQLDWADGTRAPLTPMRLREVISTEMNTIEQARGHDAFMAGAFSEAQSLFEHLATEDTLQEFLTLPAYRQLVTRI